MKLNPPYGNFHDHADALRWANRWHHIWGTRYSVRWLTSQSLWRVYRTDKPAPKRRPQVDLGTVTVTHLAHDFADPHRCSGCGEHPTLTWAHTDDWHRSGKCVDCLMLDLQRNAA